MKKKLLHVVAVACALCGANANALTCGASATSHAFGSYYPLSGNAVNTSSTITVSCSGLIGLQVSAEVQLSTGAGGSFATRRMASGVNTLQYNLYRDSGRTTLWGDGTGGSTSLSYLLLLPLLGNDSRTDTIYGRIPGGQTGVAPGNYTDTITVTIEYFAL